MSTMPGTHLVKAFLSAMEERDLEKAGSLLAPDFTMIFPGGARFSKLEDLIAWSKPRYQKLTKSFERFDEVPASDGVVVYCLGTLSGTWLDGRDFSDIRFIDRFTIRDGKLVDQKVWNDMSEILLNGPANS